MCQVLGVTKSGYYDWRKRPKSEQKKKKEALTKQVKRVFIESKKRYGSPKITKILNQEGIHTTEKNVSRIMRENNMRSKRSEEHTSELQSRGHTVCRLLLEKKNK